MNTTPPMIPRPSEVEYTFMDGHGHLYSVAHLRFQGTKVLWRDRARGHGAWESSNLLTDQSRQFSLRQLYTAKDGIITAKDWGIALSIVILTLNHQRVASSTTVLILPVAICSAYSVPSILLQDCTWSKSMTIGSTDRTL